MSSGLVSRLGFELGFGLGTTVVLEVSELTEEIDRVLLIPPGEVMLGVVGEGGLECSPPEFVLLLEVGMKEEAEA